MFESELMITSSNVWIIFSYDAEDPDWAKIKFLGNTRGECLEWWSKNQTDYIEYDPEEDEEVPEFYGRYGSAKYGLIIKEMEIS